VRAAEGLAGRLPGDGVPGLFAPPVAVPDGASPLQRLLARLGRRA
jgi:hypothetical protein